MSANGLDVFDKTIQTTNQWLNELVQELGPDRQVAWKVLSVVLRKLRDRVPVEKAAHLGAELPLLIRGAYYDQYQPAKQPTGCRNFEEFCDEVAEWLDDIRPVNSRTAVRAVFGVLSRHLSPGQVAKFRESLPGDMAQSWQSVEQGPDPGSRRASAG